MTPPPPPRRRDARAPWMWYRVGASDSVTDPRIEPLFPPHAFRAARWFTPKNIWQLHIRAALTDENKGVTMGGGVNVSRCLLYCRNGTTDMSDDVTEASYGSFKRIVTLSLGETEATESFWGVFSMWGNIVCCQIFAYLNVSFHEISFLHQTLQPIPLHSDGSRGLFTHTDVPWSPWQRAPQHPPLPPIHTYLSLLYGREAGVRS